jgi:hypothetical protein
LTIPTKVLRKFTKLSSLVISEYHSATAALCIKSSRAKNPEGFQNVAGGKARILRATPPVSSPSNQPTLKASQNLNLRDSVARMKHRACAASSEAGLQNRPSYDAVFVYGYTGARSLRIREEILPPLQGGFVFAGRLTGGVARKKRALCRRLYSSNLSGLAAVSLFL